jgi:hypothetical protein
MTRTFLILMLAVLLESGCESPVYDADVQYVERLVINGILVPGKQISGIYIGRTLPVSAIPDAQDAEVHDAYATITSDGVVYPLHHVGNGRYESADLAATPGKTYVLGVAWHGLKVTAYTLVPHIPQWDSASFTVHQPGNLFPGMDLLDVTISPYPGEIYAATWSHPYVFIYGLNDSIISSRSIEKNFQTTLKRNTDIHADGKLHATATGYLSYSSASHDTLWATVSSFDDQFYEYFYSSGDVTSFENIVLGISPGAVHWNVLGDGIGMFIGKASVTKEMHLR